MITHSWTPPWLLQGSAPPRPHRLSEAKAASSAKALELCGDTSRLGVSAADVFAQFAKRGVGGVGVMGGDTFAFFFGGRVGVFWEVWFGFPKETQYPKRRWLQNRLEEGGRGVGSWEGENAVCFPTG